MNDIQWKIPLSLQPSARRSWPLQRVRISFAEQQDAAMALACLIDFRVYF